MTTTLPPVTPPFNSVQLLQWSARATGLFARLAGLACLVGSTGAFGGTRIDSGAVSVGDQIAVLTFLAAACFWPRGGARMALFGGVVALFAAWSRGYLAAPATRSRSTGLSWTAARARCDS